MSFRKFGIDISEYQKGIDFNKIAAEGVEFIVLRAAYHLTADPEFENFYKKAKEKKFPVGAYLYTMAENPQQAREEADFLLNDLLKGKQFELPVYIDIEDDMYYPKGKAANTEIVKAFCDKMEENDYFTGVYASKYFFSTYLDDPKLKAYSHWVAQWSKENTYADKKVMGMWQFGGSSNEIRDNKIAGYVVDQNYMYRNFPDIIKAYKLNGFGGGESTAKTGVMKKGDANVGVYLLKQNILLLRQAGIITQGVDDNDIFGDGTQAAVRQIQAAAEIEQDGIAGANTCRAIRTLLSKLIE